MKLKCFDIFFKHCPKSYPENKFNNFLNRLRGNGNKRINCLS